jgi:DNA-binding winged helix-turn-helix (wHTH) protein
MKRNMLGPPAHGPGAVGALGHGVPQAEFIDATVGRDDPSVLVIVCSRETRERVLRLLADANGDALPESRPSVLHLGALRIDRDMHRVSVDDHDVSLTALEFRLLNTLAERANRVQTRATLLSDVWGMSGRTATRTVDVHVNRLREKIGSAGRLIQSVRGVGYYLSFAEPAPTAKASRPGTAAGFALTSA